ncbi:MAG: DUF4405 domain-containing protein [Oscillospiraceae bacterium]|nr:DUF4405 domain-containing protein [Oscillospiraceae bacterium]
MKLLRLKAIISILLAAVFIALVMSGAVLHFGMTGMIWGITRFAWRNIHLIAAVIMCCLVPLHLLVNRRIFAAELRAFGKATGSQRPTAQYHGEKQKEE